MKQNQPKVAIITPNYNRVDLIEETIKSVLTQTYDNWEHLIVDDGSTDNSNEIIEKYTLKDKRIRLFHRGNKQPKGACTCRNIGVENTNAEYVIFLDSDDVMAPYCIKQRIEHITKSNGLDYAVFPMLLFNEEIFDTKKFWNIDNGEAHLKRLLKLDPIAQGSGQLWRRKKFIEIGGWNEKLLVWQDVELQLRTFTNNLRYKTFLHLKPDLYIRYSTPDSISRKGYFNSEKIKSRLSVLKYAIENIEKLEITSQDLKYMAWDIISSSIKGNQFEIAKSVKTVCLENSVLNANLIKKLNQNLRIQKFKLYKLSMFRRIQLNNDKALTTEKLLGKVDYRDE